MSTAPTTLWFRRKRFGLGWYPITWQGWVVILAYAGLILSFALHLGTPASPREVTLKLILPIIVLTAILVTICYKKGERPYWRWGGKDAGATESSGRSNKSDGRQ